MSFTVFHPFKISFLLIDSRLVILTLNLQIYNFFDKPQQKFLISDIIAPKQFVSDGFKEIFALQFHHVKTEISFSDFEL